MPTYDYVCSACGHWFERFESIHDDGTKACPDCGKKKARRRLGTGAGLIFKGSGFYTTDYKRSSGGETGETKKADSEPKKPEKKKEEKEPKK